MYKYDKMFIYFQGIKITKKCVLIKLLKLLEEGTLQADNALSSILFLHT